MKWNSLILSLSLATGAIMTQPPVGMAQTAAQNDAARKLFNEGDDFYNARNFSEAEKKFREALTKYPKSDRVDRTAYYLIITLDKLDRDREALTAIENFHRNYPGSVWADDVAEKRLNLAAMSTNEVRVQQQKIAAQRAEAERRGSPALPPDASLEMTVLRMLISRDPNAGIEIIKERLAKDPSDPTVVNNLGAIFSSHSPQALPFLLDLSKNAVSTETRTVAFFYAMRRNPDRVQVANTLMEMLEKKENEAIVSETLFRMTYMEHRAVLDKIVESANPNKFDAIEKIFRGGSITLKCDLLTALSRIPDSRALLFIQEAFKNEKEELAVRICAVESALDRKDVTDVRTLEEMLRSLTRPPNRPNRPGQPAPTSLPPLPQK
jgi:outer membrane protein assembly factor BamD (BamD/ComL family)